MQLDSLNEIKNTKGKILGVDFGDVRTGLALSDPSRLLALGAGVISPGGLEKTAQQVAKFAADEKCAAIIVGVPINMDGSFGPRAQRCQKFAALLKALLPDVAVCLFDERMTTMTASRYLNETGTKGKKRKQVIDTLSAQIILQNCLDRLGHI